jgi:hypothetical protein
MQIRALHDLEFTLSFHLQTSTTEALRHGEMLWIKVKTIPRSEITEANPESTEII